MLKKILKGLGITVLVLFILLLVVPFLFQDKIKEMLVSTINKNLDATIAMNDIDLSLIRKFPQANVNVTGLSIINKAPFEGDTLVYLGEMNLQMSVKELFNDAEQGMEIKSVSTRDGMINILFNKDGIGNFDIALKKDEETQSDSTSDPLKLKVNRYEIANYKFRYYDESSKMKLEIDSLNHSGTGDFDKDVLDLDTKTSALLSFGIDKSNYLNRVKLNLDAVLGLDLNQSKYTFKQNKAVINQLPLEFNGFIQLLDEGQQYDLTFKTPMSGFKNFLALIPADYSGALDNVTTSGDFQISGFAKGVYTEDKVPLFGLDIRSDNASFKYPDLPKAVTNIAIQTKIANETGNLNDTFVDISKLAFSIDQDRFDANAKITNVVENPNVNAALKGTINLGNFSKAYPIKLDMPLSGVLNADVRTKFDMKAVNDNAYERMNNSGTMTLTGFNYKAPESQPIAINRAKVNFNMQRIRLDELSAKTGKSDVSASGTIDNFLGFLLKDQTLKGNFDVNANQIAVSDFMTDAPQGEEKQAESQGTMRIPAFLDVNLTAKANTVLYDDLVLKNVSGQVIVRDEKATLRNIKTNILGGLVSVNGNVSTKEKAPVFDMDLGLSGVDIAQTFTQLDMLKTIAPIAGVVNGKLNSTIKVGGNLDAKSLTPVMQTLNGDLAGQLLSTTVNPQSAPLLARLDQSLNFIDLKNVNLNDLKAALSFNNGRVSVKPFKLKYQDITIDVNGSHGFDQSMDYRLAFDVPAKYLGTDVNRLLAQLTPDQTRKIENVPVVATLGGTFKNPKVGTDLKQAMTSLTNQIVAQQRDNLVNKGQEALSNILNRGNKNEQTAQPKDTTKPATQQEAVKDAAKNVLKDLLNRGKKDEPKKE